MCGIQERDNTDRRVERRNRCGLPVELGSNAPRAESSRHHRIRSRPVSGRVIAGTTIREAADRTPRSPPHFPIGCQNAAILGRGLARLQRFAFFSRATRRPGGRLVTLERHPGREFEGERFGVGFHGAKWGGGKVFVLHFRGSIASCIVAKRRESPPFRKGGAGGGWRVTEHCLPIDLVLIRRLIRAESAI